MLLFYVLVFWPQSMWNFSSPTRDRTLTPCIGRQSLNHWNAREVPRFIFSKSPSGCSEQKVGGVAQECRDHLGNCAPELLYFFPSWVPTAWPFCAVSKISLTSGFQLRSASGSHQEKTERRVKSVYLIPQLPNCKVSEDWLPLSTKGHSYCQVAANFSNFSSYSFSYQLRSLSGNASPLITSSEL